MKGTSYLTAPVLPTFAASLVHCYQDADGTMQCFVWHKDQKAVCHCQAAILNLANDSTQEESWTPPTVLISQCWLNGLLNFSLSLSHML